MGPPVASLLIFLHPSPLGGVLAAGPRPPGQRGARVALLRLLVASGRLAADRAHALRPFLAGLTLLPGGVSGLEPRAALRRAALLLLGVGSFGLQSRVGAAVRPALSVGVRRLGPLLFALLLPNAVAKLLHAAEVRVVQQGEEIPVPHPVLGRLVGGAVGGGQFREDFAQLLGRDDLEVEAEQRLDEAVLHGLAVVDAAVGLGQAADQQALLRPEKPLVELDLKSQTKALSVKRRTPTLTSSEPPRPPPAAGPPGFSAAASR